MNLSLKVSIIVCLLLSGCQIEKDIENSILLDIDPTDAQKLQMSEWFQKIELIPLETIPESFIAENSKALFHGERYYIMDRRQNALFVFDNEGKFIFNTKSLIGTGPGEYNSILDFCINSTTNELEILDPSANRIKRYNLSGKYLNSFNLKGFITFSKFSAISSDIYAFYSNPIEENEGFLSLYSASEETIIKKIAPLPPNSDKMSRLTTTPFIFVNGHTSFKHTIPSNQVYFIDTISKELNEYIRLDFGKFNFSPTILPKDKDRKFYTSYIESYSSKYAFPMETNDLQDYIYQFFFFEKKIHIARYDKSKNEIAIRYSEFGSIEQLIPAEFSFNNILYNIHSPLYIEYYLSESLLDEESLNILASIKESDNPIIVKYFSKELINYYCNK